MRLFLLSLLFFPVCLAKTNTGPDNPKKGVSLKQLNEVRKKHPRLTFEERYEKALQKKIKKLIRKIDSVKNEVAEFLEKVDPSYKSPWFYKKKE